MVAFAKVQLMKWRRSAIAGVSTSSIFPLFRYMRMPCRNRVALLICVHVVSPAHRQSLEYVRRPFEHYNCAVFDMSLSTTLSCDSPFPNGMNQSYPQTLAKREAYIVTFDGPSDLWDPKNWQSSRKLVSHSITIAVRSSSPQATYLHNRLLRDIRCDIQQRSIRARSSTGKRRFLRP